MIANQLATFGNLLKQNSKKILKVPFLAQSNLDDLIKPHIPYTYLLKSTDDFVERLKQFPCNNSYRIVSFDVVSLFTNVPLSETIELIINRLYADDNPYAIPFDKDVFRKLMFMATKGSFMYKDKLYTVSR